MTWECRQGCGLKTEHPYLHDCLIDTTKPGDSSCHVRVTRADLLALVRASERLRWLVGEAAGHFDQAKETAIFDKITDAFDEALSAPGERDRGGIEAMNPQEEFLGAFHDAMSAKLDEALSLVRNPGPAPLGTPDSPIRKAQAIGRDLRRLVRAAEQVLSDAAEHPRTASESALVVALSAPSFAELRKAAGR